MNGFDKDKFTFLPVMATVREFEPTEAAIKAAILAAYEQASAGRGQDTAKTEPIGPNGQPRMLQLSGWITFADEVNRNDAAFTNDDLQEAVAEGMFKAPFFGMIDYNHDFNLYGVWYDAQYAFDEKSQKWGIYAEGVIFAWRYEDLANTLLAEQQRQGHIDLSMACLAGWYEPGTKPDGTQYRIIRKPTFFTTSVLTVDPAFPNSRAYGSEDPASTPQERKSEIASNETEVTMDPENTETAGTEVEPTQVEEQAPETATEETPAETPAPETAPETATEEQPVPETEPETPETAAEEEETPETPVVDVAALQARITDLETEVSTARVALSAANEAKVVLEQELAELRQFKVQIETERAEAEMAARTEARKKEIPAVVLAEMEKPENEALLKEWMSMDEAKGEATKKVFAVASVGRKTHAEMSAEEGSLSSVSNPAETGWRISQFKVPTRRK